MLRKQDANHVLIGAVCVRKYLYVSCAVQSQACSRRAHVVGEFCVRHLCVRMECSFQFHMHMDVYTSARMHAWTD